MKSGLSSPLAQGRRLANSNYSVLGRGEMSMGTYLAVDFDVLDLGRKGYRDAVEIQREILEEVVEGRRRSTLILVEHEPVLTLGAGFHAENLLLPREEYERRGIDVIATDRGGDVTYHAPGQLVVYPIFDLVCTGRDLHRWLRSLEEVVIRAILQWNLPGTRNPVNTGVWIENRKLCAIGIKVRRWVSMHGLALNCDLDLAPYGLFVPCGIRGDYGVTSISQELGRAVSVEEAKPVVIDSFRVQFGDADEDLPEVDPHSGSGRSG